MIATGLLRRTDASARERKSISDSALSLNALVIFAALMTAWFYRLLEIEIGRLAWIFFGYTALHFIGSVATDFARSPRLLRYWFVISNVAAVLFLSFAWPVAGGIKNTLYLITLAVPVIVSGLLQTRITYLLAILSFAAVTLSALAQSAELSWTAQRIGLDVSFLNRTNSRDALPGAEVTPSFLMLMLLLFGFMQLFFAALSRAASSRLVALMERLIGSEPRFQFGGVAEVSVATAPSPTVIVYSDSAQIHLPSRSFVNQMLLDENELAGRILFDVISFDDARSVRELLARGGTRTVAYRIGAERRVATASIHRFESEGEEFALIRMDEFPVSDSPHDIPSAEELLPSESKSKRIPVPIVWCWAVVAAIAFGGSSQAQVADNWYVALQYDRMSTDDAGGGASVEWHRPLTGSRHLLAGAFAVTMSDSTWQYARLGFIAPLQRQLTLTLGGDIGAGELDGEGFDYRIVRGSLRRPITGTRYSVEGEAQHLVVHTAHGLMLKAALHGSFTRFDASLGVHGSASGNLDAQFVSGRIDVPRPTRKFLAGFAVGRSQPDVRQLAIAPQSSDSLELFLGVTATPQITVVFNTMRFEQVSRYSALLSWKTTQ